MLSTVFERLSAESTQLSQFFFSLDISEPTPGFNITAGQPCSKVSSLSLFQLFIWDRQQGPFQMQRSSCDPPTGCCTADQMCFQ
jgi:hypothetical protein